MSERYNPDTRGGGKGWLAVGAFVVGYDILANETLSNAFARGREHENPLIRGATVGLYAVTAVHLLDLIPEEYDPIDRFSTALANAGNKVMDWTTEGIRIP